MGAHLIEFIDRIKDDKSLSYEELIYIAENGDLEDLMKGADDIRRFYKGDQLSMCGAMNVKSGKCSEDCRYCSQSAFYKTYVNLYEIKDLEEVKGFADFNQKEGVCNFELSTSGGLLSYLDKDKLLMLYNELSKNTEMNLCGAHGILRNKEEAVELKEAGLKTYQHNLQSSERFYPNISTTHEYKQRVDTLKFAKDAGLRVCSGGIIGLGENMSDRIEMALVLREIGISSMPINVLNPIPGTPFGDNPPPLTSEEIFRTIAIYRFALPNINIIYGAGRIFLGDEQYKAFRGGMNGIVVGNFLTTKGRSIADDVDMVEQQGFSIPRRNVIYSHR